MSPTVPSTVRKGMLGATGVLLGAGAALGFWAKQVQRPPKGRIEEFHREGRLPGQQVVVCLGASIVHGRVSVDFVDLLRRRFPASEYAFVNAGLNGDLAYNVLQRLDPVVGCDPDYVVILVGTNDVQSTLSEKVRRLAVRGKHLPQDPSIEWYRQNLETIVARLRQETPALVGLCSLPVLGEDLTSIADQRVGEFNDVIRQVAEGCGAAYLPVHERQIEHLTAVERTQGPPYTDNPIPVMLASMQRYLLRQSFDSISRGNGLALTTDRIHMNSAGAGIIAEEIERFLKGNNPSSA